MKDKPTSRDLQAQATRQKLLQTSMELIAAKGFSNVTINQICKECNVSVGTFYLYFKSKKDIITLVNRQHNEYLQHVCEIQPDKTASEIYRDYVRKYMEYIAQSGFALSKSLMQSMLEGGVDDADAGLNLQRNFFHQLLAYGRATKEFARDDITDDDFFEMFLIAVNGILANWFYSEGAIDIVSYGCRHAGRLIELLEK